jgi:hypothetical protein
MAIDRDSFAYRCGRWAAKAVLIAAGYLVGRRWGRRPIDKFKPKDD